MVRIHLKWPLHRFDQFSFDWTIHIYPTTPFFLEPYRHSPGRGGAVSPIKLFQINPRDMVILDLGTYLASE